MNFLRVGSVVFVQFGFDVTNDIQKTRNHLLKEIGIVDLQNDLQNIQNIKIQLLLKDPTCSLFWPT